MAQTWTAFYPGVTFAVGKNMASVMNSHAVEILRIRRICLLNNQVAAVAGVLCQMELRRYTGASIVGGVAVVPVPHASANVAPAAAVYNQAGAPGGASSVLRRMFRSSEEANIIGASYSEIETIVPLNIIWDAGYGDANVQALTLRQDESVVVWNTAGAVGTLDTWIEFTKE
jgi:hypothetical protein